MNRYSPGRVNSKGNFDRRYATGYGRTSAQQLADRKRRVSPRRRKPKNYLSLRGL